MTMRPCIECGEPSTDSRCTEHRLPSTPKRVTAQQAGYDRPWRRLSERARRIQPWCSDCGATDDLTGDHSPEAWRRRELGLPIRLEDIDVVCRPCNSRRGRARPRGDEVNQRGRKPSGQAKFESENASHLGAAS